MASLLNIIRKSINILEDKNILFAWLTWPKFSLASFLIASRVVKMGIKPRTVIDVGANVGQFAVASANLFPGAKIHSFEPVPDTVIKLTKNVSKFKNVKVYPCALGDQKDRIIFNINSDSQVSSALQLSKARLDSFPDKIVINSIEVEVERLDEVIKKADFLSPVLLKIDAQGFEDRVIYGAKDLMQDIDYILLEASLVPLYEGELNFMQILELCKLHNFELISPVNWMQSPKDGTVIEMDLLFKRSLSLICHSQ